MQDIFLAQAAAAHLGMALRLLDRLGADLPAAHLTAAIEAFKEEPIVRLSLKQFIEDRGSKFAEMDALIDEMFGLEAGRKWMAVFE